MSNSPAAPACFDIRPSLDRVLLTVKCKAVARVWQNLHSAIDDRLIEEDGHAVARGQKIRFYNAPSCGLRFAWKTFPSRPGKPRRPELELYDISGNVEQDFFIETILKDLAGTSSVSLSLVEFTRDLYPLNGLTLHELMKFVTDGIYLPSSRGIPIAWTRFKNNPDRPTLYLGKDGCNWLSRSFVKCYTAPADSSPDCVRVELTLTRKALVAENTLKPFLHYGNALPVSLISPLDKLSWVRLDEEALRKRLCTRKGLSRPARRLWTHLTLPRFLAGKLRLDGELLAENEAARAVRRALNAGKSETEAYAEGDKARERFRSRLKSERLDYFETALNRWRDEPGGNILAAAALVGRLRKLARKWGLHDSEVMSFFPEDSEKIALIRAGRAA
jgi:hypothetical protein